MECPGEDRIVDVACGERHALALTSTGDLLTFATGRCVPCSPALFGRGEKDPPSPTAPGVVDSAITGWTIRG